jgi:hypothetical protein
VVELCDLLEQTRDLPVECGGLYHTVHGLELYRVRMFGEPNAPSPTPAPTQETATAAP